MAYVFRPRTVRDYDPPRALDHTERELKARMCLLGAGIFRERLGPDHALTAEFEAKAEKWLASLGSGAGTSPSVDGAPVASP
jgi:hypothetical protein